MSLLERDVIAPFDQDHDDQSWPGILPAGEELAGPVLADQAIEVPTVDLYTFKHFTPAYEVEGYTQLAYKNYRDGKGMYGQGSGHLYGVDQNGKHHQISNNALLEAYGFDGNEVDDMLKAERAASEALREEAFLDADTTTNSVEVARLDVDDSFDTSDTHLVEVEPPMLSTKLVPLETSDDDPIEAAPSTTLGRAKTWINSLADRAVNALDDLRIRAVETSPTVREVANSTKLNVKNFLSRKVKSLKEAVISSPEDYRQGQNEASQDYTIARSAGLVAGYAKEKALRGLDKATDTYYKYAEDKHALKLRVTDRKERLLIAASTLYRDARDMTVAAPRLVGEIAADKGRKLLNRFAALSGYDSDVISQPYGRPRLARSLGVSSYEVVDATEVAPEVELPVVVEAQPQDATEVIDDVWAHYFGSTDVPVSRGVSIDPLIGNFNPAVHKPVAERLKMFGMGRAVRAMNSVRERITGANLTDAEYEARRDNLRKARLIGGVTLMATGVGLFIASKHGLQIGGSGSGAREQVGNIPTPTNAANNVASTLPTPNVSSANTISTTIPHTVPSGSTINSIPTTEVKPVATYPHPTPSASHIIEINTDPKPINVPTGTSVTQIPVSTPNPNSLPPVNLMPRGFTLDNMPSVNAARLGEQNPTNLIQRTLDTYNQRNGTSFVWNHQTGVFENGQHVITPPELQRYNAIMLEEWAESV